MATNLPSRSAHDRLQHLPDWRTQAVPAVGFGALVFLELDEFRADPQLLHGPLEEGLLDQQAVDQKAGIGIQGHAVGRRCQVQLRFPDQVHGQQRVNRFARFTKALDLVAKLLDLGPTPRHRMDFQEHRLDAFVLRRPAKDISQLPEAGPLWRQNLEEWIVWRELPDLVGNHDLHDRIVLDLGNGAAKGVVETQ